MGKLEYYKSSKVKLFNPLPLIIVSSKYIDCYLGFENVIILKNPKYTDERSGYIYYDEEPHHIGNNLKSKIDLEQYENGVLVRNISKKKCALLVKKEEMMSVINDRQKEIIIEIN